MSLETEIFGRRSYRVMIIGQRSLADGSGPMAHQASPVGDGAPT
jgi:hypothetical protein